MAYGIQNYDNVEPPDGDYPSGKTKDNDGSGNGTPANTKTHNDLHQLLAKFLREAGITPNGLPDNEYSGNQHFEALGKLFVGSDGALAIKTKVVEIVNWNLAADDSKNVVHSVPYDKIVAVRGVIRGDAGFENTRIAFGGVNNGSTPLLQIAIAGGSWNGQIPVWKTADFSFSTANFDQVGGYVRGWLLIDYLG